MKHCFRLTFVVSVVLLLAGGSVFAETRPNVIVAGDQYDPALENGRLRPKNTAIC